jgi:hypothetical protein
MKIMTRYSLRIMVLAVLSLVFIFPVTATLVTSGVSFSPTVPLVPGGQQHLVATYTVIPSGSTTFAKGHLLQMQTDLARAQWTIQVTLDGRDAALQTASGSVAFVNGAILSYSTDHDVGMVVTINGTVPADAAGSEMVLQVRELDNSGTLVPGSILSVPRPVAGPASPAATPVIPALTPPLVTPTLPKGSPGFAFPVVISALIATVLLVRGISRKR